MIFIHNLCSNKPGCINHKPSSSCKTTKKMHVHLILDYTTPATFFVDLFTKFTLLPVVRGRRRSRQAKVCTLGAISLSCQTWLRRPTMCGDTTLRLWLAGQARLLKECFYALFNEQSPEGVNFQTRVSCPSAFIIGFWMIAAGVSGVNKEFIKSTFQFCWFGIQRSVTVRDVGGWIMRLS